MMHIAKDEEQNLLIEVTFLWEGFIGLGMLHVPETWHRVSLKRSVQLEESASSLEVTV